MGVFDSTVGVFDSTMGVFDFTISAPVSIAISLVSLVESSLLELDGVPGFL